MKYTNFLKLSSIGLMTSLFFSLAACGVFQNTTETPGEQTQNENPQEVVEKSGPVLWNENCTRCHGAPHAGAFSEQQWEVIGKHMRIRANLTAEETEKIVAFLQQRY